MEPPARESTLTLRLRAAKEFELSGKTNGPDWKRHEARIWDEREYRSGLVGARLEGIARGREAAFDEGFKEGDSSSLHNVGFRHIANGSLRLI